MSRVSYVNGRFFPHKQVNVHVEDRGYQFADGVYEVILVKNRLLVDEIPHLDRLEPFSNTHMTLPTSTQV